MLTLKKQILAFALISTAMSTIFSMDENTFRKRVTALDKRVTALDKRVTALDKRVTALTKRMEQLIIVEKKIPKTSFEAISERHFLFKALKQYIKKFLKFELNDKLNDKWEQEYSDIQSLFVTQDITTQNDYKKIHSILTGLTEIFSPIEQYYVDNDNVSKKFFFHINATQNISELIGRAYDSLFTMLENDILNRLKIISSCNFDSLTKIKSNLSIFVDGYRGFIKSNPDEQILSNYFLKKIKDFLKIDGTKKTDVSVLKKLRNLLIQLDQILKFEYKMDNQFIAIRRTLIHLINSIIWNN